MPTTGWCATFEYLSQRKQCGYQVVPGGGVEFIALGDLGESRGERPQARQEGGRARREQASERRLKAELEHGVLAVFAKKKGLKHLRVRRQSDTLVIESDDLDDPFKHARLRRVSVHYWRLEMPAGSRWDVLPDKRELNALVDELITLYPWMLAPVRPPR